MFFCVGTRGTGILVLNSVEKIIAHKFATCILEAIHSILYLNIISYCELSLSFLVCLKNLWILPEIISLPSLHSASSPLLAYHITHTHLYIALIFDLLRAWLNKP